jgi:cytochrome c
MTTAHGLWPGRTLGLGKPDVRAVACMKDCGPEPRLASFLPDFARDAHGNLAEQNRAVGAQVGADTTRPAAPASSGAPATRAAPAAAPAAPTDAAAHKAAQALTAKYACVACHGLDNRIVGPSFREVAKKYAGRADAAAYLAGKIKAGGSGVWGGIPMPPQALGDADAKAIAQWLADGAVK